MVTADWVRGLDVTDIRVGGYHTVLVDPCQKNQKTYQRAQVGDVSWSIPAITSGVEGAFGLPQKFPEISKYN